MDGITGWIFGIILCLAIVGSPIMDPSISGFVRSGLFIFGGIMIYK